MGRRWLKEIRSMVSIFMRPLTLTRCSILICCVVASAQLSSFPTLRLVPTALAAPLEEGPSADPSGGAACGYGHTQAVAEVHEKMLTEASAIVASQRRPGVYWTLNDSKNEPMLFAVDQQGRSLGRFRVRNAENVDWESLQLGPGGDDGAALYIGDTGDNKGNRREMVIYRVPEPEPAAARGGTASTAMAEAFRFVYPEGPHNTEAMLVHPETGEVLLITKEPDGHSLVFRVPTPLDGQRVAVLEQVGTVDVSGLAANGDLVTDASVAPDARRVIVRTYTSALEYDVVDGAPLASIWDHSPRIIPLDDGTKGEGVTYRADGSALITIGEDATTLLFETPGQC